MYDIGVELQAKGIYTPALPPLMYYQEKYRANADGETTNEESFPQACLDAEMAGYPEITDFGVEDAVMNSLNRGGGKTAKEMLSEKKLIVSGDD